MIEDRSRPAGAPERCPRCGNGSWEKRIVIWLDGPMSESLTPPSELGPVRRQLTDYYMPCRHATARIEEVSAP